MLRRYRRRRGTLSHARIALLWALFQWVALYSLARHALYGMPITHKTEVSDAELEDMRPTTRNRKKEAKGAVE